MRELARAFLLESANQSNPGIACVAHRLSGTTHWFAGEFVEAREHHLQALAKFDPMQDRDLAVRFNQDIGATVMAHLAFVFWPLGEVDRARHIFDEMTKRSAQISHVNTVAMEKLYGDIFELTCRNFDRVPPFATALARVARDYDIGNWKEHSAFLAGWTEWYAGGGAAGVTKMRRGVLLLAENGIVMFDGLLKIALAEAEGAEGEIAAALATVNHALAESRRTGHRCFDAELHRTRGEVLLKQNPADPAPAEATFLAAIAVAQQQKARSFELRAALSLAKLYQSTGRPVDAHDVLGPALERFSQTPEFPQIAEAKALFEALAHL